MKMRDSIAPDIFVPYMRDVGRCEQSLRELGMMWRTIESSAKMNCPAEARAILPAMATTRSGFADFETALIDSLVREKVGNVRAELIAKAQTVIDVVVRNLYERTADVSFLATDRALCAFVAGIDTDRSAMQERLRAYRDKYTVYEDIVLLAPDGRVLAQIDDAHPVECSRDPLVAATLAADGYLETFRATDLRLHRRAALVYSHHVQHPETGAVAGVLCLCFAFDDEMAGVFRNHGGGRHANLLLLDGEDRVIASADPLWIPPGAVVPVNRDGRPDPVMFAGRVYLACTMASAGYQGYPGPPGWQAQVMVPLDVAFGGADTALPTVIDPGWAAGVLGHADVFCPPLAEILAATTMIRRVVWNAQVITAGKGDDPAHLEHILEQIGETGRRSDELFARSVRDLFKTALSSSLCAAGFTSRLLVDLLDRNLYERANDCRWWALSPELRTLMAEPVPGRADCMARTLRYINGLYTVYTSIFVYDTSGAVVASSTDDAFPAVDADTLAGVMALRGDQDYRVSAFSPSPYYGNRPTYVFHAAIRDPRDESRIVGGIGLVFDAAVEFHAMLTGAMDGAPNLQAYFVDHAGTIIAATDPSRPVGVTLDVDHALLASGNGMGSTGILVHDDQYAVLGSTMSSGYREFKNSDGYRCDITAVVVEMFGPLQDAPDAGRHSLSMNSAGGGQSGAAYATFLMGAERFALAAGDVREAVPASRITRVSMGTQGARRGVLALDDGTHAWVFELGALLRGAAPASAARAAEVLVVRLDGHVIGLLVDALHSVTKFDAADILANPIDSCGDRLVGQVIRPSDGDELIQVLDVRALFGLLAQPQAA